MTTTPTTTGPDTALSLLFGPAGKGTDSPVILSDAANANLDRALQGLPPAVRGSTVKEVRAAASGLLDVSPIDLLIAGWRTYDDLTSAARRTLAQPGSNELVALATHRVSAEQKPFVNVLINGQPAVTVQLTFAADFDVSALLAEIRDGLLVAIRTGRCDVTASLAVDDVEVATQSASLDLPGAIHVDGGIRLLPAAEYQSAAGQPGVQPAVSRVSTAPPAPVSPIPGPQPGQAATGRGKWWEAPAAAGAASPITPSTAAPVTSEQADPSEPWWEAPAAAGAASPIVPSTAAPATSEQADPSEPWWDR